VVGRDYTKIDQGIGGPQDPASFTLWRGIIAALPGLSVCRAERIRRPLQTEQGVVDAMDTLVCAVRGGRIGAVSCQGGGLGLGEADRWQVEPAQCLELGW
jgi:hypothetical protein